MPKSRGTPRPGKDSSLKVCQKLPVAELTGWPQDTLVGLSRGLHPPSISSQPSGKPRGGSGSWAEEAGPKPLAALARLREVALLTALSLVSFAPLILPGTIVSAAEFTLAAALAIALCVD